MPFIHRFLTPREEKNMVFKTFSNAVKKQYPEWFDAIMEQIWKMPYDKLLRASLTSHHVNIYVDLAVSRITGVSQYDRYVKRVRRLSRVIGEIEDTPFLDLPKTDDVLMDHLFMKVCEFCPERQTAEAITHELYEQGHIECRTDIVDMLEQPLLLKKRVKYIYKQIEDGSLSDLEEEDELSIASTYPETSSLSAVPETATTGGALRSRPNSSLDFLKGSTSAIFTNNFDELFEKAAAANNMYCGASDGDISYRNSSVDRLNRGVEALRMEVINETTATTKSNHDTPSSDLMKFSPAGPKIKIVVEGDVADADLNCAKLYPDSDSDEILSLSIPNNDNHTCDTSSNQHTSKSECVAMSTVTDAEVIDVSKSQPVEDSISGEKMQESLDEDADKVARRVKGKKKKRMTEGARDGKVFSSVVFEDECCDLCTYEKRYSQMMSSPPTEQQFEQLRKYLDETGESLPNTINLPPECDISILLDPGNLESDDENDICIPSNPTTSTLPSFVDNANNVTNQSVPERLSQLSAQLTSQKPIKVETTLLDSTQPFSEDTASSSTTAAVDNDDGKKSGLDNISLLPPPPTSSSDNTAVVRSKANKKKPKTNQNKAAVAEAC